MLSSVCSRNMDMADGETRCPHMESCEMYDLFTYSGTLAVWKINYCTGDYETCARYKLSSMGQPVPVNLMPNGKVLNKSR